MESVVMEIARIDKLNNFGRIKLTASLNEEELTSENILLVLKDVLPKHIQNAQDITYLEDVVKGNQDIYEKEKKIRANINNKVVENVLRHAIQFKVGYVFDEVQYVQVAHKADDIKLDEDGDEKTILNEVNKLNTYFRTIDKDSLNKEIGEALYTSAVAPVFVYYTDNDEIPFEIYPLDGKNAFVVYSSGIRGQRLFSVRLYVKKDYKTNEEWLYMRVTTKKNVFTYKMENAIYTKFKQGDTFAEEVIKYVPNAKPKYEINALGDIPIFEYTLNKDRVSLVEVGLDSQNVLNQITSADMDDIEQYVQNMTVLFDADVDKERWEDANEQGVILLKTTDDGSVGKRGNIEVLSNKMQHSETKIYYDRVLNQMLTNLGIPLLNIGGGGGDTGQARLTDNGWIMADTKARTDEANFRKSEKPLLKYVLNILKRKDLIEDLSITNISINFNRNKVDNLQSKAQTLQTLIASGIHPQIAIEQSNLFSDSAEVYNRSVEFYGKDFYNPKTNPESSVSQETQTDETLKNEDLEQHK